MSHPCPEQGAHITAPTPGDSILERMKGTIDDGEPSSQIAATSQYASKLYTSAKDNRTTLEPIHRTESPLGDTDMRGRMSSEANHKSTACRRSRDIWMKYVLEGLLFPGKRHYDPAVPGRRTEARLTLLRAIYGIFLLCRHPDTKYRRRCLLFWTTIRHASESNYPEEQKCVPLFITSRI